MHLWDAHPWREISTGNSSWLSQLVITSTSFDDVITICWQPYWGDCSASDSSDQELQLAALMRLPHWVSGGFNDITYLFFYLEPSRGVGDNMGHYVKIHSSYQPQWGFLNWFLLDILSMLFNNVLWPTTTYYYLFLLQFAMYLINSLIQNKNYGATEMDQWFLQGSWVQFAARTWWFITIQNSSSVGSDSLFWPVCVPSINMVHIHTWKQNIYTYKLEHD